VNLPKPFLPEPWRRLAQGGYRFLFSLDSFLQELSDLPRPAGAFLAANHRAQAAAGGCSSWHLLHVGLGPLAPLSPALKRAFAHERMHCSCGPQCSTLVSGLVSTNFVRVLPPDKIRQACEVWKKRTRTGQATFPT
jgi:hypothetical protein